MNLSYTLKEPFLHVKRMAKSDFSYKFLSWVPVRYTKYRQAMPLHGIILLMFGILVNAGLRLAFLEFHAEFPIISEYFGVTAVGPTTALASRKIHGSTRRSFWS